MTLKQLLDTERLPSKIEMEKAIKLAEKQNPMLAKIFERIKPYCPSVKNISH